MKFSFSKLKSIRVQTGKSREDVTQSIASKDYKITYQTLANWETGATKPTVNDIERLAKVYKCELWDFFAHEYNSTR